MKLIKIIGIFAMLLLITPIAYAQTETVNAGITSDSSLYGLDVMLDSLSLRFQLNNQARFERSLEIAEERLAETEEMINQNKFEFAEQSRIQHQNMLNNAEEKLELLENEDNQDFTRLKSRLEAHTQKIEQVRERLQEKLQNNQEAEQIMNQIQISVEATKEVLIQSEIDNENRQGGK